MNKIESYIDSVIPKNIPKSKQQKLKAEIESHIYDRIDFYEEIGYDTDSSINKALADMGEDEETKTSIRNDFEALHHERNWWAVAFGAGFWIVYAYIFETITDNLYIYFNYRVVQPIAVGLGFLFLFVTLLISFYLYFKGFRKCLLGLSVGILFSILRVSIAIGFLYPCFAVSFDAVIDVVALLLDKYTSVNCYEYGYYGFIALLFNLIPLVLYFILKIKGNPDKSRRFAITVFSFVYMIIAIPVTAVSSNAFTYFQGYNEWFGPGYNAITPTADELYKSVNKDTSYDEFILLLRENEYITADEFEQTLSNHTAKQFRYNLDNSELMLNDDYEIWVCPGEYDPDEIFWGVYGFIYILKGDNGTVNSIGVGNLLKDIDSYSMYYWPEDKSDPREYFVSLKGGERETEVMSFYGKEKGDVYGKLKTFSGDVEQVYYRIYLIDLYVDSYTNQVNVELWFEDGMLNDGKLHYYYEIPEEGRFTDFISLSD